MSKMRNVALALGMALGVTAPAAQADVVFDFKNTGGAYPAPPNSSSPAPSGNPGGGGQLVVFDEAYASGYSITYSQISGVKTIDSTVGLRGFTFFGGELLTTPRFFYLPYRLSSNIDSYTSILTITAAPYSLPVVSLEFSDINMLFSFNSQGETGSGFYGLRGTGLCYTPGCFFTTETVQSVPEPASMALFGAGLLGLAAVRRRRG